MCSNNVVLGLLMAALLSAPGCGASDTETTGDAPSAAVPTPVDGSASAVDDEQRPRNPVRAELARYRLSMDDLRRWARANTALNRFATANPEIVASLEGGGSNLTAAQSLTALEQRIDRVPEARAIVESAGLTPHSYALITLVLVQVQRAQAAMRQGLDPERVASELGVSPDNIRFVQEHQAEIAQLRTEADTAN